MGMVKSQTDQAITIGGEPARLLNMQCPAGSGFLVEIATTIHDGTAYVFTSQNLTGSGNQTLIVPRSAHSWPVSGFSREGPAGRIPLPLPHRSDTAVQALHFPAQRHQFPRLPLAPGIRRAGLGHARVRFSRRPADDLGLHCQVCG
jgi:hypothetical protein